MNLHFHGSYLADDVTVLLQPYAFTSLAQTDISGLGSVGMEMAQEAAHQRLFDGSYMRLFEDSLQRNCDRVALDAVRIARALHQRHGHDIAIVSLMRAGTVAGVLLQRALRLMGCRSTHYTTNVVQGLRCAEALDVILSRHSDGKVVFVDGWTGKGSVAGQLKKFIAGFNQQRGTKVSAELTVFSDPGGVAALSAGGDEYMQPHALLRVTGSGLFSGAIADADPDAVPFLDACVHYDNLKKFDVTQYHLGQITAAAARLLNASAATWTDQNRQPLREIGLRFVEESRSRYGADTRVRPGLCEAARALVKYNPKMVLRLRNAADPDVPALIALAERKGHAIHVDSNLPYRAAVMVLKNESSGKE